jgi:hypothetical protein
MAAARFTALRKRDAQFEAIKRMLLEHRSRVS